MAKKVAGPTSPKRSASRAKNPEPTAHVEARSSAEDQIRRRAYEIFLQRRGQGGSAEEDWLRAEAEVRAHRREGI